MGLLKTGLLTVGAIMAVAAISVVAILAWQAAQKPKGTPHYVALGSSFAAGLGLGPRAPDSPFVCQRSTNGYPQQLARMRSLSLVDMTCSGATTRHVRNGGQAFLGPQLDALTSNTQLVTLTAGGNDLSYVGDLTFLAGSKTQSMSGRLIRLFWKGPRTEERRDFAALRKDLLATLLEIRRRSPQAQIIVVTYPAILPPAGTCPKLGITEAEADKMRMVGEQLADLTRQVAKQASVLLVDMQTLGIGHDACSSEPWVNGWSDVVGAPFHPTLAGAKATAEEISKVLDRMG